MPVSPDASSLAELERALAASHPGPASDAALRALRGNVPPFDVLLSAARTCAARFDSSQGLAPHGLATLAAALDVQEMLDPRHQPLPVLQAIALAASERKLEAPQRPAAVVSGEVTHLGRSALLAMRRGDMHDAESVFLGIVEEGWERRMTGEILFRASIEDPGESGHKLLTSVALWRLARALGFRDARTILRPAAQYLVKGEKVRGPFDLVLSTIGKQGVDLETLAAGGRPLDDTGRGRLATAVAAPTEEGCVVAVLGLLHDGYAATSLAGGVGEEAAKRLLADAGYHSELVHGLTVARAAHFVLDFSRSSERLYALFQAALRVRSPAPLLPSNAVPQILDEAADLGRIAEDVDRRKPTDAAANVSAYLHAGHSAKPLISLLAYRASLDSAVANEGHNLLLADACLAEFATSHAPEFLMALAKSVAASPQDVTASKAWASALGL